MEKILVTKSVLPDFDSYIEKIRPLWESRWLTNMGNYHQELEDKLSSYMETPYISLMVNGHMALEMALQAMNFPEGAEVITTPFTFISTTHAIVRNGLKPVFCDIKLEDYTMDETRIEQLITEKTVAIIPVHVYGNICNVKEIERIAYKYSLKVIYDAAHAFGEKFEDVGIANYGDASTFSFHATKVFHSIEGGAVAFKNPMLYERLYNLKNFGIRGEELVVEIGANAKMSEFAAAMGLCNLENIKEVIEQRKEIASVYIDQLSSNKKLVIQRYDQKDVKYNYGYFPVRFSSREVRDTVYEELKKQNIFARKYFYPLTSDAACFENKYAQIPLENARRVADTILVLPLYPDLEKADIIKISKIVGCCC